MINTLNACFAYKFWKKNTINIFDEPNDTWFKNKDGNIENRDFNNNMRQIAKKYKVSLQELLAIIEEASTREVTKSFQGLGGCNYTKNNITTILNNIKEGK